MKKIAEPLLCIGEADQSILEQCAELGQAVAAGLSLGIY
jgi:hypothetical protein